LSLLRWSVAKEGYQLSIAAAEHGLDRRRQGYSAAMLVEESRMLEVSIFQTLQNHRANIDFSLVLAGVMVIADEVDSQLGQAMIAHLGGFHFAVSLSSIMITSPICSNGDAADDISSNALFVALSSLWII
jgi:hypothetical protein